MVDDRAISELLREVRKRAGFQSAQAAATAYGWSGSTLSAHEGGRRRIGPLDAERYADTFGMKAVNFLDATAAAAMLNHLAADTASLKKRPASNASEVGHRLIAARIARGFRKRARACAFFGFPRPMLTAHELGIGRLVNTQGSVYAKAYAIELPWLLNGTLPSGLGDVADERIRAEPHLSDATIEQLARISNNYVPTRSAGLTGTTAAAVFGLGEIREVVADRHRSVGYAEVSPPAFWSMPEGFDRQLLGSSAVNLVSVPDGWGGRFFVDTNDHDIGRKGRFLYVDRESRVHSIQQPSTARSDLADPLLVGRILAQIIVFRD